MSERTRNDVSDEIPRDRDLTQAYRDAAREVPPDALDAVILAAARRDAQARSGAIGHGASDGRSLGDAGGVPLRRWHMPLALAAVLVLSVSIVTLSREEAQLPAPAPSEPPVAPELRDAPAAPVPQQPQALARKPASEAPPDALLAPLQSSRAEAEAREDAAVGATANKAEETGETRQAFQGPQAARAPQRAAEATAPAAPAAPAAEEPPEKWGERIMALRRDGKTDEADALLAEFRKRYPGYSVPEGWLR